MSVELNFIDTNLPAHPETVNAAIRWSCLMRLSYRDLPMGDRSLGR